MIRDTSQKEWQQKIPNIDSGKVNEEAFPLSKALRREIFSAATR